MREAIEALLRAVETLRHAHDCCWWNAINADAPCSCGLPAAAAAVRASLAREPVELSDKELTTAMANAAHVLENLRIWGGMGWNWYQPTAGKAWKILTDALAVASAARGEK